MQNCPDAAAMLDAVANYLADELLPDVPAARVYHLRVAVNALRLCRREILAMPAAVEAERTGLVALLGDAGEDNRALSGRLANAIAAGALGFETPNLVDHLWETTLAQLAIDQPNYGKYASLADKPVASEL